MANPTLEQMSLSLFWHLHCSCFLHSSHMLHTARCWAWHWERRVSRSSAVSEARHCLLWAPSLRESRCLHLCMISCRCWSKSDKPASIMYNKTSWHLNHRAGFCLHIAHGQPWGSICSLCTGTGNKKRLKHIYRKPHMIRLAHSSSPIMHSKRCSFYEGIINGHSAFVLTPDLWNVPILVDINFVSVTFGAA